MKKKEFQRDLSKYVAVAETCACANFRKASRAVTQLFDQVLEPSGLRSTQLIILLEIAIGQPTTVPQLSRRLFLDHSTLARNLKLITKQGWIKSESAKRRRSRLISLTPQGLNVLEKAVPRWKRAQDSFVSELGEKRWRAVLSNLSTTATITHQTTLR